MWIDRLIVYNWFARCFLFFSFHFQNGTPAYSNAILKVKTKHSGWCGGLKESVVNYIATIDFGQMFVQFRFYRRISNHFDNFNRFLITQIVFFFLLFFPFCCCFSFFFFPRIIYNVHDHNLMNGFLHAQL